MIWTQKVPTVDFGQLYGSKWVKLGQTQNFWVKTSLGNLFGHVGCKDNKPRSQMITTGQNGSLDPNTPNAICAVLEQRKM